MRLRAFGSYDNSVASMGGYTTLRPHPVKCGRSSLAEGELRAWQVRMARKKPSSIQRVVNDLKAALNAAFMQHRKLLPADLPTTIRYGLKIEAPEMVIAVARDNQILTDDEVRRVVAAAIAVNEDFGRLVVLLAATGARFSQLARMDAELAGGEGKGRQHLGRDDRQCGIQRSREAGRQA
jgi:hypothetical protein